MRRLVGIAHPSNSRRGKQPSTAVVEGHNRKAGKPVKQWRHQEARRTMRQTFRSWYR